MKVYIHTFGCKVNQYETQAIKEYLKENCFEITSKISDANCVIVNSCTVTSVSDGKIRRFLLKARRENKNAILILTGCAVFTMGEKAKEYADIVMSIGNYSKLKDVISCYIDENDNNCFFVDEHKKDEKFAEMQIKNFSDHTRAFVKIEDGCDNFCSYCVIPYARGRVRSKRLDDIKKELGELSENGYKEIVLTGISLTAYGKDMQGVSLVDAVKVACEVENVQRVRLGSLDPDFFTEDVVKQLAKETKLCPHFHLSLQSGCDETLKRMNRHYTTEQYKNAVDYIRKHFSNPAITTDVIVGFAGENNEEFEESVKFIQKIGFSKVHVFPYSIREGTRGAKMLNQVPADVKSKRVEKMLKVTDKLHTDFLKSQVGQISTIMIERQYKNSEYFEGFSENYTPVLVKTTGNMSGKLIQVKIDKASNTHCIAKIV